MAISILYLKERKSKAEPIPERILYHLSLDRSFSHVCADIKKRDYFLFVVENLTNDKNEILFRQEIVKDFENNPALLEQIMSLSTRFEELRITQKTAMKDEYRLNATGTASSATAKNIMQAQALCLKRSLLFVKAYGELLEKYDLKSQGLKKLRSACKEMYENPDFAKLVTFCSKYENFSASGYWDFKFAMNGEGRIEACELIDHRYIHVTDSDVKKKGFSFFKKAEEPSYPCERLSPAKDGVFENLAISALSNLSSLFKDISEQIFAKFGSIGRELFFYGVALKYVQILKEKKVPVCYPTFMENQSICVKKLYDLNLLVSKPNPSDVIPNDFVLERENSGLLVFGNNGSGKTVYLRSIGTMQILAQAGLPVACESAEIAVFSQLATQFSEAEKEFSEGNAAGRFEQEVRELAIMVDTLKEGALVLLNEPFQSTAYAEGAEGLYHLLNYFSKIKIRWILVSHLRQMERLIDASFCKTVRIAESRVQ